MGLTDIVSHSIFYLFAVLSLGFAIAVVKSRRILRAAFYLMTVLILSAGFYLMLKAEFVAGIQILVYVGGIVILIVYAVMLTRSTELIEEAPSCTKKIVGFFVAALFFCTAFIIFKSDEFNIVDSNEEVTGTVEKIGKALLDYGPTGYILPFEIISLLLLAAVIGSIVIARKADQSKETTP